MTKRILEASQAIAMGTKLCEPKVIPMYPITPQTHIVERLADYINDGDMDADMIHVESEHSALSAFMGAAATGVRTFTATASQGLALMYEILPIVSGNRLPGVMAVANRALSAPINIWNDHSDSVSARDQGWIQIYVESSQEALDAVIQGYKISENENVSLPLMVCLDGFTLSHVYEPVDIPEKSDVSAFLPKFKSKYELNPKKPITMGPIGFPDSFMELKQQQQEAMKNSLDVIKTVNKEFNEKFGREYGNGLIEEYKMEDAEYAVIGMGTVVGTSRVVVDKLRESGEKVGLVKLRSLRPLPREDLKKSCENLKALAVLDRHVSLGFEGALTTDLKSVLKGTGVEVKSFVAGLGGRDVKEEHIKKAFDNLKDKKQGEWLL